MKKSNNKDDIDIIIFLLNKMKSNYGDASDYQIHPASAKYLLGQVLRHIVLPDTNIYLSHKADVLWRKLKVDSNDFISDFTWQMRVYNENEEPLDVLTYKGASKSPIPRLLNKGYYFHYRQVFHDDHIIPMKAIINELVNLSTVNYDTVMNILDKICICRMLKNEDRKIKERSNRPFSKKQVIEEVYLSYGIYLKDYDYPFQKDLNDIDFEQSIHLAIPKEIIIKYLPHPEINGNSLVELPNGMVTDIYTDESGDVYSITNDNDLIKYVMRLQEAFA